MCYTQDTKRFLMEEQLFCDKNHPLVLYFSPRLWAKTLKSEGCLPRPLHSPSFSFQTIVFLVKSCCMHYPQCSSINWFKIQLVNLNDCTNVICHYTDMWPIYMLLKPFSPDKKMLAAISSDTKSIKHQKTRGNWDWRLTTSSWLQ